MIPDAPQQVALETDGIERVREPCSIPSARRCREADQLPGMEITENRAVRRCGRMLDLVDHDDVKGVWCVSMKAGFPAQRLDGRADNILAVSMLIGFFDPVCVSLIHEILFRLPHQFVAVRKPEHASVKGEAGCGYCLAEPCRKHDHGPRSVRKRVHRIHAFLLIIP